MDPLTCAAATQAASDELAGVLADDDRRALAEHVAGCPGCACLLDQLRTSTALLGGRRGHDLAAHLPRLYAHARALDDDAADDLVQESLVSALADPDADPSDAGMARALEAIAAQPGPRIEPPTTPIAGDDPDADEPELFYPTFYVDGPDAGAWIEPPVAWGESRVLGPAADLLTAEVGEVVDAALARLDPLDASLLTLVDVDGAPFGQAVVELDLPRDDALRRLAAARLAVRGALDRHLRS